MKPGLAPCLRSHCVEELMAHNDHEDDKIFGDLKPAPGTEDHIPGPTGHSDEDDMESMEGGSQGEIGRASCRERE